MPKRTVSIHETRCFGQWHRMKSATEFRFSLAVMFCVAMFHTLTVLHYSHRWCVHIPALFIVSGGVCICNTESASVSVAAQARIVGACNLRLAVMTFSLLKLTCSWRLRKCSVSFPVFLYIYLHMYICVYACVCMYVFMCVCPNVTTSEPVNYFSWNCFWDIYWNLSAHPSLG